MCFFFEVGCNLTHRRYYQQSNSDQNAEWSNELDSASTLVSGLCTFLLSFFVSVVLSRWWSMRDAFGGVQGGVRAVIMVASTYCTNSPEGHAVRDRLKRYALAVHAITIKTERTDRNISDLVTRGLLLASEADMVQRTHQREYMLLSWMSLAVAQAGDRALLVLPLASVPILQNAILALRSAVGTCGLYTTTQLPFPYLHLLTVIVKMNLLTIALQYGQEAGLVYSKGWFAAHRLASS